MWNARGRLACLWTSQAARALADWCLRLFVVAELALGAAADYSWHVVTAVYIAPFILLSPFNGALSNGLPRRGVLIGSSAWCLVVAIGLAALPGPATAWPLWVAGVGLMALGHAVYSPTRYALLPAAAHDTRLPLTRVNGWIELGGSAAIVAGMLLGLHLAEGYRAGRFPLLLVPATAIALNLLALLTALPVHFPADVRRPEPPAQAIAGFFHDTRRVGRDRAARATLLGLAGFLGLVTAGSGAVFHHVRSDLLDLGGPAGYRPLYGTLASVAIGAALGSGLAGLHGHPRRSLGLVPIAATGLLAVLAWAALHQSIHWLPALLLGVTAGLANVPLRAAYQAAVPPDARGNGMAVMNLAVYVTTTALALLMTALASSRILRTPLDQLAVLAVLAGVGALVCWYVLFLPWLEQTIEIVCWPLWRIRAHGPGLDRFPARGPLIVLGNHTAWMDAVWMMKLLPRQLTPMMTSDFYDLPGIRWLMRHVVHPIRVPAIPFRREAPELDEAVAILDRGGCLLIFPEGWVKRNPDQLLRQFGQGVWRILERRPDTPVVVCWIEGGWGSLTSYDRGPPLRNKPIDWWRPIDVAIREPEVLDPSLLKDQRATRAYLMRACLETRTLLGLPPEKSALASV